MTGAARPNARSRRDTLLGAVVSTGAVILMLFVAELGVRLLGTEPDRWALRNFAADPITSTQEWSVVQPDPVLGWTPRPGFSGVDPAGHVRLTFDGRGLRVHHAMSAHRPGPRPILVLGDSYTMGDEVGDDETFPAHLEAALGREVLNAGVLGYGLDQTILRGEELVPRLAPDMLIVGFIADDVHRAGMKVLWGRPKPYFVVAGEGLALQNVPVPPPIDSRLDLLRAVLGYSRAAHVLFRRLHLESWWMRGQPEHFEAAHGEAESVSCRLMKRLRQLADEHGLRVMVLAQHSRNAWLSEAALRSEHDGASRILECAGEQGFEGLDSEPALEQVMRRSGVEAYYASRHMNDAGNRLTAKLIAQRLGRAPE